MFGRQIQYKAPARYDDVLKIEVWPIVLGRIKLSIGHRILDETSTLIVEACTVHVCTSTHDKPKRLPADLVHAWQPYLRTAP